MVFFQKTLHTLCFALLILSAVVIAATGECNKYGDITNLRPTGASADTANQLPGANRASLTGIYASRALVDEDVARLENLRDEFTEVGNNHCIHPALIAAIASRESRAGNALDVNGMGDGGRAFGIMQCDTISSGLDCRENEIGPRSVEHVNMLVEEKLLVDFETIKNKEHFDQMSKERQLQAAVASYNFGTDDARSWGGLDVGSTGDDYSNDIMARAQWLIQEHGWVCSGDNCGESTANDGTGSTANDDTGTSTGECNKYGDITNLSPTGASADTANQLPGANRASLTGIYASRALVDEDVARLENLREEFTEVGNNHCIHPALIAAIASRESRAGNALDVNGMGDGGRAFGIMQCDTISSGLDCRENEIGPRSVEHVNMLVEEKLLVDFETIKNKEPFDQMAKERQLQAAVASYNFGTDDARSWGGLDVGSTGDDYSNDIMARAQWLIQEHGWVCSGDNCGESTANDDTGTSTESSQCSSIEKVSRTEWHAAQPTTTINPLPNKPVKNVFIHHTTGGRCYTQQTCSTKVKGHQNYHINSKGWSDIGYNYLVGEDGRGYEGRGWDKIGGHTYGYNTKGVAISVVGDYMQVKPNNAALNAIKALINCAIDAGVIDTNYNLYGHRDKKSDTSCPGDKLYEEIQTWPHFKGSKAKGSSITSCLPSVDSNEPATNINVDSCTKYGNILSISATGAKQETARQDNLSSLGVSASNKMVDKDFEELEKYKSCFYTTGKKYGIHPALIAAIASRVSRGGTQLSNTQKFGMMQCDLESSDLYDINCRQYGAISCEHVDMMVKHRIIKDIETVQRIHSNWTPEQQLQGAIAAYDFETCLVQTIQRLDVGSTGDDYSHDVVARAQRLINHHNWNCEGGSDSSNGASNVLTGNVCKQMANSGNCEFYKECAEKKVKCGEDGYALNYGYKYCTRFTQFYNDFDQDGKQWVDEVRICLMKFLYDELKRPGLRCEQLKDAAFNSHVDCYVKSANGICSISWDTNNAGALWDVYQVEDFFGDDWGKAWKQVVVTMVKCSLTYGRSAGNYLSSGAKQLHDNAKEKLESIGKHVDKYWDSLFGDDRRRKKRSTRTSESECEAYAAQGNCKFYECFEDKFACAKKGNYSHIKHFELTNCMEFDGMKLNNPDVGSWMTSTQTCLMAALLPLYQRSSLNCMEVELLMELERISCMISAGFCSLTKVDEWILERATNLRGFPNIIPHQYTTLPISRASFKNDLYYYRELRELKRQIGVANEICAIDGLRSNRELYRTVYSPRYGTTMKIRNTEL